jgi:hypothetical protein
MTELTNWKELISFEMKYNNESFDDVVFTTLSEEDLLKKFDSGYGMPEGCPFTLWTKNRVYFPVTYDGAESVQSVPRNPSSDKSGHFGGC